LTPREWTNLVTGFNERENRNQQNEWERTRWQTTILLNVHTKKTIKARDLIVFPWEAQKKKQTIWTKGEIIAVINERNERAKLKHGQSLES